MALHEDVFTESQHWMMTKFDIICHICHTRAILKTFSLVENLASLSLQDRSRSGNTFAQNHQPSNHQPTIHPPTCDLKFYGYVSQDENIEKKAKNYAELYSI